MSNFVANILQFQEIIVYNIPPGRGGASIASLRSTSIIAHNISLFEKLKNALSSPWVFIKTI